MKYQIVVRYERENYRSAIMEAENIEGCRGDFVADVTEAEYFGFETESGGYVLFPEQVLRQSIFSLEVISDES